MLARYLNIAHEMAAFIFTNGTTCINAIHAIQALTELSNETLTVKNKNTVFLRR